MMKTTQKLQIRQLGESALAPGPDVVDLAPGRRDVAAGRRAVPVPGDDRAAQVRRDGVGAGAGVQRQADRGGRAGQGAGAQQRGEPPWPGQQGDRVGGDEVADGGPAGAGGGEPGRELVEQVRVEPPGHNGRDGRVAFLARRGDWAGQVRLRIAWPRVAVHPAGELFQAYVQLQLDGLAGAFGQTLGRDEEAARLLQCVVVALRQRSRVLRAGFLAEGVQDGLQGGGAVAGEVGVEAAGTVQGGLEAEPPVFEPELRGEMNRVGRKGEKLK